MANERKQVQQAKKGMLDLRKELEKERNRLKATTRTLQKHARSGSLPDWGAEAAGLFRSPDYSFGKLLKLLRKNKIL